MRTLDSRKRSCFCQLASWEVWVRFFFKGVYWSLKWGKEIRWLAEPKESFCSLASGEIKGIDSEYSWFCLWTRGLGDDGKGLTGVLLPWDDWHFPGRTYARLKNTSEDPPLLQTRAVLTGPWAFLLQTPQVHRACTRGRNSTSRRYYRGCLAGKRKAGVAHW